MLIGKQSLVFISAHKLFWHLIFFPCSIEEGEQESNLVSI